MASFLWAPRPWQPSEPVFLLLGLLCTFFFSTAGITFYVRSLVLHGDLTILALVALLALFGLITFGARHVIQSVRSQWIWKDRGQVVPLRVRVDWRVSLAATAVWRVLVIGGLVFLPREAIDLDPGLRPMVAASGVATGLVCFAHGFVLSAAIAIVPLSFAWSWLALAGL